MRKKPDKWERIAAARDLLGLEPRASLEEIRLAYRRKAKEHHPDTAAANEANLAMHRLTDAYRTLTDYCQSFPIPLEPDPDEALEDDEDWWMKRFGPDPLWGKKKD